MKATTHGEIYRPFEGQLRPTPFRFLTIGWSGIRHGLKRKMPLLLLFAPTTISGIVTCVFVHLKFTAEAGTLGPNAQKAAMIAVLSGQLTEVAGMISSYIVNVRFFALLATVWYGAGLIAEDRRVGAHLLYFSRPITRLDYLLGKFTAAAFFGACSILGPAILICATAAFSSPNWSFVTQKGHVILETLGFCLLWITTLALVVLAVSSLVERKTWALVGVFALILLAQAGSAVLGELTGDEHWQLFSLFETFQRIADGMFGNKTRMGIGYGAALQAAAVWIGLSLLILARRLRRMEVVA